MNLFNTLIPYKLQLNILQLEEYKLQRFLHWIAAHFFTRNVVLKKPLVVTIKIKNIILLSLLWEILLIFLFGVFGIFILTQPWILFTLSLSTLAPYELYNKRKTIERTRNKILSLKKLKVIGITGSFGKTSTKELLYQLLKDKYKVIRTPESYNTIFGIAKVVDYEVDENYDFFICEMAAYKIGEIKTLAYMVHPRFGILTGIAPQHLERFRSLNNIIQAKFELFEAVDISDNIVFNLEDEDIIQELEKRGILAKQNLKIENIKFAKTGSTFDLIYKNKRYKTKTKLFGFSNIKNILSAVSMAIKLGISISEVIEKINSLEPTDNRFTVSSEGKTSIINNTYSSNVRSFEETVNTALAVSGKKAIVTPGLVELGSKQDQAHKEIGKQLSSVFDKVILVGKNKRTQAIFEGLSDKTIAKFINDNRKDYFEEIQNLKGKFDWIFLENDLSQNY